MDYLVHQSTLSNAFHSADGTLDYNHGRSWPGGSSGPNVRSSMTRLTCEIFTNPTSKFRGNAGEYP